MTTHPRVSTYEFCEQVATQKIDASLVASIRSVVNSVWKAVSRSYASKVAFACVWLIVTPGCAGYQFGTRTLYNPEIRTINVPMVRNDTFRHELSQILTEAIVKAIELRTPYKVVANPNADSTLTCRLTNQTKRTIAQARTDEPRAAETRISLELSWTDRFGNQLLNNRPIPLGELAFYFVQGVDFVPEGGQSMATAQLKAAERLADDIVSEMENRW